MIRTGTDVTGVSRSGPGGRVRAGDVVFFALFAAYAVGALALLAQGAGAVFASVHEPFHQWLHVEELGSGTWARVARRMAGAHEILPSTATIVLGYLFSLLSLALAFLALRLRPRDRTARMLAVGLVGTAGIFNLTAQVTMEFIPLTPTESFLQAGAHILGGLAFVYALLLFPDGRPVPRWPAPALATLYLPVTAMAVFLALRVQGTARPAALLTFFGLAVPLTAVGGQIYRFRRATDETERQQARLLFWALLPAFAIGLYFLIFHGLGSAAGFGLAGRHLPEQPVIVFRVFQPVFALVPLALFLGLLRYRMWDIDRVINRTLVYGVATGSLVAAFFGIVVVFQGLFRPFTQGNELAVATSTLAVAAAFVPVRSRVQRFVDRRFYRSHYDAVRSVEAFTATLRERVDLETLVSELRGVVAETVQPEHVTLLMRDPDGTLRRQWTYRPFRTASRNVPETPACVDEDVQNKTRIDIAPNDPLLAYLIGERGPTGLSRVQLASPGLAALRGIDVRLLLPLVSQGELIALLGLGPRLSTQDYSTQARKLLEDLASHAAPALRVAQVVQEQEAEARARARYEAEMRVAQLIQQNLLPRSTPNLPGWQVAAYYHPAREVGGDFYDFIELPDGRLGLVCGDVTDKGVPAAMVMASTRSVLRAAAVRRSSPGEVLAIVNDEVCPDMPEKMFVTCLYAILEPATGRLVVANAGHNPPYLCSQAGRSEVRARGMPLGLMPGSTYEEIETTISSDQTILLHSDGLAEAHGPDGEMFGFPRVAGVMHHSRCGQHLIDALLSELRSFTGATWEQEDDITLVVMTRTGGGMSDGNHELASFTLPSEPGREREAMEVVAATVHGLGLADDRLEKLKTAVAEATMNAIEHGNGNDPDLPVDVVVTCDDHRLTVRITDRGGHEETGDAPAPDLEAKLAGEQTARGWGLFLIKNMVDELRTQTDGELHTVELVMDLGDTDA